jgi:hypothetical protein
MQGLRKVAPITPELADERLHKLGHGGTVVDLTWGSPKSQPFALIGAAELPLKALNPPPGGLPPCGEALKDLVRGKALLVTHGERRRVEDSEPRAAALARGEVATPGHKRAGHELAQALVAHQVREIGAQGHRHILRRVMCECAVRTPVQGDQERQQLAERQRCLAGALALAEMSQAVMIEGLTGLAEIVDIAEDSKQLVHRGSLGCGVDAGWKQLSRREPLSVSRAKLIPNSRYHTPKTCPSSFYHSIPPD